MKLKRLVSAVLAIGMALTILPTAAFAETPHVTNVKFNGEEVDTTGTTETPNPVRPGYTTYTAGGSNWQWVYHGACYMLTFGNAILAPESTEDHVENPIKCQVYAGGGSIENGTFEQRVVLGGCKVNGENYYQIENRNGNVDKTVENAFINIYQSNNPNTVLKNSIVYGNVKMTQGTIESGIICNIPDNTNVTVGSYQTLTAEGGIITPVMSGSIPADVKFMGKAYIVGNQNLTTTFTIKPASPTFAKWDYDKAAIEAAGGNIIEDENAHSLTVTMPATGNVDIKAVMEPADLKVGVVDGKTVPVYNGAFYAGSDLDGWHYDEKNDTLTVYKDGSIDLGNNEVDWKIDNYGIIEGGIFNYKNNLTDSLTNEEGATIKGGTFNVIVENSYGGTIDGGLFKNNVRNYGVVNGGTFMGGYSNVAKTGSLPDNSTVILSNGYTYGGVFNHSANFSHDNFANAQEGIKATWITLNNCTANGISGMVGIVGNQTLTIEADTACTGWGVSTDADYEEKVVKQIPTDNANTFTLSLSGDDERNVTLTALLKEGYYRMNLVDGTATNANGDKITSAKVGDTVKLTAADAPEGMVFDRWEITPTNVELELKGGFEAGSATTSFVMPAQTLTIRAMYRMADVEEPDVLGTVAVVATAGVGAAVLGWTGYNIAADLYAQSILPEGTAIPETKEALAVMLWQNAGKPEVAAADGASLTESEQAQQWVVANGLMENEEDGTFHPEKGVGKFAALNTIKAQQEAANTQ